MKGYILKMMGFEIQIDEDEIPKIINGVQKGSVIILKRGIMNPSSFSGIIEDPTRRFSSIQTTNEFGHYVGVKRIAPEPLEDLFPQLKEKIQQLKNNIKILN